VKTAIDTIRTLAMDAVQAANSGHPGTPMALAPVGYTIWQKALRYDPQDSRWPNRDRFVLSVGHASMLLYGLLHLAGVKDCGPHGEPREGLAVTLDEIKKFRQLDSKTPGHPEFRFTAGVETTTGPLGQGLGNSVGMAIASRWLAARYNKPGFTLFDFDTYALCGDGCMMEGVASEAASLAGHLKLSNLCWLYDNNTITIEGHTDLAFSEDVAVRFLGYGWNVLRVADANDIGRLETALKTFKATKDRPTLVIVDSVIGYGAPNKANTHGAHGEPLGEEEIKLSKRAYGWTEDAKFLVPDGVREHFQQGIGARGAKARAAWTALLDGYKAAHPELATELDCLLHGKLPEGWDKDIPSFPTDAKGVATRDASGKVLNAIAKRVPWLIGGSADLAPSTKTRLTFEGAGDFQAETPGGRNFHFGVREHAMGSVLNGMSLGGVRPYGAGFLIFSDYSKPALRLSAVMEVPTIHVFTHDSIGVGEDGPTHQPIEQLMTLRATPGFTTIRPGDANEVAEAWRVVMGFTHEPCAISLTRQAIPTFDRSKMAPASGLAKGAYILCEPPEGKTLDVILIGTGSEVQHCVAAREALAKEGIGARVVSMPCWELFAKQSAEYRENVLPHTITARVAVEMGGALGWERYVGPSGRIVAMRSFGASAPLKDLLKRFGFTTEAVVQAAKEAAGRA